MKRLFKTNWWTIVAARIKGLWTRSDAAGKILIVGAGFYAILIVGSFINHYTKCIPFFLYLDKGQLVTYGVGLLAAVVVYSQIVSLREQLQVQTLVEYSKQWNSPEMVEKRKAAMDVLKLHDVTNEGAEGDLDKLEQVLELLEDFSTLAEDGVLDEEVVWESSLGWYASRYCYYSKLNKSLEAVRKKWGINDKPDNTYYKQLETLYNRYLNNEVKRLNVAKARIEDAYLSHKNKFIKAEAGDE